MTSSNRSQQRPFPPVMQPASRLVLALATFAITGCSLGGAQAYRPNPPEATTSRSSWRVAVVEFEDHSPAGASREPISVGLLYQVPLVPYVTDEIAYNPTAFGRCFADELDASGAFGSVDYYTNWTPLQERYKEYDLIVTGVLHGDKRARYASLHGLGWGGFALLFVGAPVMYHTRHAGFELFALRPQNPNEQVWKSHVAIKGPTYCSGFYYDFSEYPSCPTDQLRPQFMALRRSLMGVLSAGYVAPR